MIADEYIARRSEEAGYERVYGGRVKIGSDIIVLKHKNKSFLVVDLLNVSEAELESEISSSAGIKMHPYVVFKSRLYKTSEDRTKIELNGLLAETVVTLGNMRSEFEKRDPGSKKYELNADRNYGKIEAFLFRGELYAKAGYVSEGSAAEAAY